MHKQFSVKTITTVIVTLSQFFITLNLVTCNQKACSNYVYTTKTQWLIMRTI